jgi:serine/threonine-protein kinase
MKNTVRSLWPTGEPKPLAHALAPGAVIDGKYAIEDTVAEGGIAVVVRAMHTGLGQRVAIKYLKPHALTKPDIVARFAREASLTAQIASENVVRVTDVGNVSGAGPYMVMEYLVGRDLGSVLEEGGALPIERAVDYVLQACDALAEAHALDIVHRDIKPENLFLAQRTSNTAILKIIDFGISKVAPKRGEDGSWAHQTDPDDPFGTPLYMSPEQLWSPSAVDRRTDIWALGVVLFELVTGVPPFEGEGLAELCTNIIAVPPKRLRALLPGAPEALEAAILKCLEKDPAKRFRNVGQLAEELAPFGAPNAISRVTRIGRVVRRGRNSSLPPTPAAFAPVGALLPARSPISSDAIRPQPTVRIPGRRGWPPRRMIVAALGCLAVVMVIGLALFARRSPREPAPVAAGPAASAVTSAPGAHDAGR